MEHSWKQFIFGKLVVSPKGEIVKGHDHECTGMSAGIPSAVQLSMIPSVVGPGTSDLTNWFEYAWNEEGGGIAIQPVFDGQDHWVVAGRVRGRSEEGEEKGGRFYTQTQYLTQRASDYDTGSVWGLFHTLDAQPMTESNKNLPEIHLNKNSVVLKENWLERIRPFLRYNLSKLPFAVKSSKFSLAEISELFHLVHSILPKTLAWRMGLRIGAETIQENDVTLSWGQDVYGGPRMIGYSWDDFDRNDEKTKQMEGAVPYPSDPDYRVLGDRYLEYIEAHFLNNCSTDIELQQAVKAHFPHLDAWDAIDPNLNFADAAEVFIWDIFEKDGLQKIEQANNQGTEYPPLSFFKNYRKQALTMVFDKIWLQGQNFIRESITEWPDIWTVCAKESKEIDSVYALFFEDGRLDKKDSVLRLTEKIPEIFHQRILDQLQRVLQRWSDLQDEEASFWESLSELEQLPNWIETWLQANGNRLFWIDLRRGQHHKPTLHRNLSQNIPSFSYVSQIVQGDIVDDRRLEQWFGDAYKDVQGIDEQDKLVEHLLRKNPLRGLHILALVPTQIPLKNKMQYPVFTEDNLMDEILHHIFAHHNFTEQTKPLPRIIEEMIIVAFHKNLSEKEKYVALGYFRSKVSSTWGWLFFGPESNTNGTPDYDGFMAGVFCDQEMTKSLQELYSISDDHLREKVCDVYFQMLDAHQVKRSCLYSQFRGDLSYFQPQWDKNMVLFSLRGLSLSPSTITDPQLLKIYLSTTKESFRITRELFLSIFQNIENDEEFWTTWISDSQSQTHSGWRMLWRMCSPTNQLCKELDDFETAAVLHLENKDIWKLYMSGVLLPVELFDKIASTRTFFIEFHNDEELSKALWLSFFSEHENFKRVVVEQSLLYVQEKHEVLYSELQQKYSGGSQGWFSSVVSKVGQWGDSIGRSFASEIPAELNLQDVLSESIEAFPEEQRPKLFPSK